MQISVHLHHEIQHNYVKVVPGAGVNTTFADCL